MPCGAGTDLGRGPIRLAQGAKWSSGRWENDCPDANLGGMIEAIHISKKYGSTLAVDDVSFSARPGTVTGFLGPNGAGKSTALRMIVGLTPASSGQATIFGSDYRELPNPAREVGVLLDASAQHPGRTGRETVRLSAQTIGVGIERVHEMLDLVGLNATAANRRVGAYSLGMRQRLGLAQVMLGHPRALILDEPANGLDPQGIIWLRGLLRDFADRGGTVLLSSHLLHEIDAIADQLVLINRGRIVARGAKAELLPSPGTLVRAANQAALELALEGAGFEITHANGALIVDAEPAAVGAATMVASVPVTELRPADNDGLEKLFLSMTATDPKENDR
jgi:ABC-2 type transport system ATP-binding protein